MGDLEKMQPRPFKRDFFRTLTRRNKDAASRRLYLMSFERHGEIYPNDKGADDKADAPAHHSNEFPAGYSLAVCSPALSASALPAAVDSAAGLAQLWGLRLTEFINRIALKMKTV